MGVNAMTCTLLVTLLVAPPRAKRVDHESAAVQQVAHGDDAVKAGDHAGAIKAYEQALSSAALIPDFDVRYDVANNVRLRLAEAHLQAHLVDRDASHLETAETLLDDYVRTSNPAEPKRAQALFDEINARRYPPKAPAGRETRVPDDIVSRPASEGRPMVIAGATLTAVGGIATIGLFVALGVRSKAAKDYKAGPSQEDRDAAGDRHRAARSGAIASGLIAAAAFAAGIPLLFIGLKKRKASRLAIAPFLGTRELAFTFAGRF